MKRMAFQDNAQEADLLVDLDPKALNSLEVDLEAVDLSVEPPMLVVQ